ncbi:GNAT family N-acetyltransferase [Actinomycetospora cinnamomea]|uniref:Ribosomal protein S18 acetylase RimI-like enzyme n=1 Tax=Actinomycetospora cinnamomea TaxID=663609 RepID=A0A2U1FBF7_9PSEU|nr:GNAT family N-acetyltransferase [Actinomycetospora cinnamomea]PVZ09517.1 ribosomal protein S18 acetylase RimI-like enzyme [Actinomycetospora cinnamomea]
MTLAVAPPVVRAARPDDLPAVAVHMRGMLERELGGYDPRLHADVDDLARAYLASPGTRLFVCLAEGRDGPVVAGTASVRPGGPKPAYVPEWLAARYAGRRVGQICRVWVDPAHRRLGVGRMLATEAARWASAAGYDPVCLHTNAAVPGALAFWTGFPGAVLVHDARPDPWSTVHFEIDPAVSGA